jgi:hypothetical protein
MTAKVDTTVFIEDENPQQCDDCGNIDELRPYGPGGSMVCFDCGMKDEEEAKRRFFALSQS